MQATSAGEVEKSESGEEGGSTENFEEGEESEPARATET